MQEARHRPSPRSAARQNTVQQLTLHQALWNNHHGLQAQVQTLLAVVHGCAEYHVVARLANQLWLHAITGTLQRVSVCRGGGRGSINSRAAGSCGCSSSCNASQGGHLHQVLGLVHASPIVRSGQRGGQRGCGPAWVAGWRWRAIGLVHVLGLCEGHPTGAFTIP